MYRITRLDHKVWSCIGFLALLIAPASSLAGPSVEWEVVNRFPLFTKDEYFVRIAGVPTPDNPKAVKFWASSGQAADTINAEGFTSHLREMLPTTAETAWRPQDALYDRKELMRTENKIVARSSLQGQGCIWRLMNELGDSRVEQVNVSCALSKPFPVDITKAYSLQLLDSSGAQQGETIPIRIHTRLVIAMGDSFASGEGNPDHPAIFNSTTSTISEKWMWDQKTYASRLLKDARWLDPVCHRSLLAWPSLTALRRAVQSPHEVVRFASFACSGAEVYDGILTAQKNPPGAAYSRDGLRQGETYQDGTKQSTNDKFLLFSQIEALSHLMCEKAAYNAKRNYGEEQKRGIRQGQQPYFVSFSEPYCESRQYEVDDLLLMIGGNDAGFSGIVAWILEPQELQWKLPLATPILNAIIKNKLDPIPPKDASKALEYVPKLYAHVRAAMDHLGVPASKTQLALYPDVIGAEVVHDDAAMKLCNRRTAEGFTPFQTLVEKKTGHSAARFGAWVERMRSLSTEYIEPLRETQIDAIGAWGRIDTKLAFMGMGLCATSACSGDSCVNGDRLRWPWKSSDKTNSPWMMEECERANSGNRSQVSYVCETPPLRSLSDFDAYAPSRARGLRYATDAYLATAAQDAGSTAFRQDGGMSGSAHPTANVHARIADQVRLSGEQP